MPQKIFNIKMANCLFNNSGLPTIERLRSMLQDSNIGFVEYETKAMTVMTSTRNNIFSIKKTTRNFKTYYI